MVDANAHLSIVAPRIAERVLDLRLVACRGAGEDIIAHCDGNRPLQRNLMVVVDTIRPPFPAVDRETSVFLVATIDNVAADKIRHGLLRSRAELIFGCFGRLEEHVRVAIGVKLACGLGCRRDVIALLLVHLGDVLDRAGPVFLDFEDLRLGDWRRARARRVGHRRVMQEDAHLAVLVLFVAEGVFHRGLGPSVASVKSYVPIAIAVLPFTSTW